MISGLHSCRVGNEPIVGQIKTFTVQPMTGKSGKPYTKIRSASDENGGQPYKILKATPTGHTDSYGNVSFNLEIEPSNSTGSVIPIRHPSEAAQHSQSQSQRDTPRQYMMRAANLLVMSVNAAKAVFRDGYERELATTLFIQAARNGMVEQMPAKPFQNDSPQEQTDPEPESDEPPF